MSIRNLTKGQRFYKVDAFGVIKIYEYHEPLPKNENYHIVLMNGAYPERMFQSEFADIFLTYDNAVLEAVKCLELMISLHKEK